MKPVHFTLLTIFTVGFIIEYANFKNRYEPEIRRNFERRNRRYGGINEGAPRVKSTRFGGTLVFSRGSVRIHVSIGFILRHTTFSYEIEGDRNEILVNGNKGSRHFLFRQPNNRLDIPPSLLRAARQRSDRQTRSIIDCAYRIFANYVVDTMERSATRSSSEFARRSR